jgi:hypothetical protein
MKFSKFFENCGTFLKIESLIYREIKNFEKEEGENV